MLDRYWADIPVGRENAVTYDDLCVTWGENRRKVRRILHELSLYDNGDNYILIRSSKGAGGFFKTDNQAEIDAFRRECLSKGLSIFAPVKKINRVMRADKNSLQMSFFNNLRAVRKAKEMKQTEVVEKMQEEFPHFDVPMLSKLENGCMIPGPAVLNELAEIYDVSPTDLILLDKSVIGMYCDSGANA